MPTSLDALPLFIRLFGPLEVRLQGQLLRPLRTRRGEWLLALLALRRAQPVDRAWLAGTLWPESDDRQGAESLRRTLTDLRQALGQESSRILSPTTHTLSLHLAESEADVIAFDQATARGDLESLEEAVSLYRGPMVEGCHEEWLLPERLARAQAYLTALETLSTHALAHGDSAAAERYLRRAVAADPLQESSQRTLMQTLAGRGSYGAAVLVYRALRLLLHRELHAEPDPETQALFEQLKIEARRRSPARPLTAPKLAASAGHSPGQPVPENEPPAQEFVGESHTLSPLTPAPHPPILTSRVLLLGTGRARLFEMRHGGKRPQPLDASALPMPGSTAEAGELRTAALLDALIWSRIVGRDAELAELRRRVDAALQGTGATLFLSGEPGIGKTRLATETAVYARLQGFLVLVGRCEEEGTAPYQPFAEAVREYLNSADPVQLEAALPPPVACELVRLVPQIASKIKEVPQVPPLPAEQARQALIEAAQQFFTCITTHEAPLLLFLDDLHWADEGSLALLHALSRHGMSQRLLIVGTYRDVELDTRHPLERTLSAMNRERLYQRLSLRRLPEGGVAEMVAALLAEAAPSPAFVSALHHETEGNPFFIEEVLKHLVEEGAIYREEGRWQIKRLEEFSVPPSIKVTIGRRLERLGEDSRGALTLAAVIGQQFSFEALLQASELEEERLLEMVEEWLGAHLVIEERRGRDELYRFQHALIREVLYGEVALRRKARLHERVGLALEAMYANRLEERLEELASHFAQARSGPGMEKGVNYCLRAGEQARNLYAHEAAIRHLTAALELLDGLPADEPHLRQRWEGAFNLQKTYSDCRAFDRAVEVLQEYLALAQRVGYPWGIAAGYYQMAGALFHSHEAAGLTYSERSYRLRMEHLEKCLQVAEQHGLTDWQARARAELAFHLCIDGADLPRAEALLRGTLEAPEGLAEEDVHQTYGELIRACALQGKWDELAAALRQSIPSGGPGALHSCLGIMENALDRAGKQADFIGFCAEAKALYAQADLPLPLHQWYLEPATPSEQFRQLLFHDEFEAPELRPEWQWHDPVQVSTYSLADRHGFLTLRADLGVDLYPGSNLNAPRMLLEVRGDFALETKMEGDWDERNSGMKGLSGMSGLLVWKDSLNFLRLEKFSMDQQHRGGIHLEVRIRGEYRIGGRGLLRGNAFYLRLERAADRFAALCSTDGVHWLTCGQVVLPVKDPLLVGVAALHGMVVHFDSVQLMGRGDFLPK